MCFMMSPTRQKEREKKRILFLFVFGEFQTNLNGELGYFIFNLYNFSKLFNNLKLYSILTHTHKIIISNNVILENVKA